MTAGTPQPGNADPLAKRKAFDPGAFFDDDADDFVAENERQSGLRQIAVDDVQVGPADAAGPHLEHDLPSPGAWPRHFGQSQGLARCIQNHRFHAALSGT